MNISLINPPYLQKFSRQQRSPAVIKSGTLYYPYWLSYAAGILDENGFKVSLIDAVAENLSYDETIKRVLSFKPNLVVIETSTPSIENDIKFCQKLKTAASNLIIVLVGTHPSVMYEEILSKCFFIDAVTIGEYEYTVLEIAKKVLENKKFNDVEGIAFCENDKIVKTTRRDYIQDLDRLPFVSKVYKKYLSIEKYYFSLVSHPMIMLITGRGCPNYCFFCVYPQTLHGRKYRYRSPENVVEELEYIKKEFPKVKAVVFEDDTFAAIEERVIQICELIIKRNIRLDWFANLRVNTKFETLKTMKNAGLVNCAVGFESGEQSILNSMKKGITISESLEFKKNCDKLGISVHGCFMVGFPGETGETMLKTFKFAKKLNCDSAQFYPLFLYPGTDAYKWALKNTFLKTTKFSEWLNDKGHHNCIFDLPNLSANEMVKFCEDSYKKYYLSKNYLLKKIKQSLKSYKEAKRNFISGINFLKYLQDV